MPFTINISEYELNKIYIFDVPTGCYPTLEIINDTNINVISVQQKEVRKSDENDPSYIAQYRRTFELNNGTRCSISPVHIAANKLYIMFSESNPEALLVAEKYILASEWIGKEQMEFNEDNYLINDTEENININMIDVLFGKEHVKTVQLAPQKNMICRKLSGRVTITQ